MIFLFHFINLTWASISFEFCLVDNFLCNELVGELLLDFIVKEFETGIKVIGGTEQNVTQVVLIVDQVVEMISELLLL